MDTLAHLRPRHLARLLCCFATLLPFSIAAPARAASEPSLITGKKQSFGYSWQEEVQLGAQADKELVEGMGAYDDPKLQAYIQSVGERVLQQSNFASPNAPEIYRNTKFTFRVIDSPVVNAFALPGGYVYVTRGLLAHVQNEAQLAVVLGHEIAHVAARHASQQANRSKWAQLGVIAGAILGQKVLGERAGDVLPNLVNAGGQALQMFMLKYSREAEHESDNLGVTWANRAGYASGESARFFNTLQRLSANEAKALPTWASSHPDPGDRAKRVLELAAAAPAGSNTNVGEEEFLKHIEGLTIGEDPREGFAQNGVFYHPVMKFQFPLVQGWKMENQRAAVVFAEPNGRAMMGLRLAPGTRARDAAQQFAQQAKVQVVNSGDTAVNGLPTSVIIGQAETEQGLLGVWNAFIEYDNKVYSILGYAPAEVFNQVRTTFENTAAGFAPLQNAQALNVQPARLKLVRADRNAQFATFMPTSLPQDVKAEDVALMNQATLTDPVNQGRVIKIPDVTAAQPPPQMPATPTTTTAQTYPPQTTPPGYPPQSQPAPPASPYPPQTAPGYPQPGTPYPPQTYPPQTAPSTGQAPQQPGSPQQPSPYPQPSTYPQTTYPQPYPAPQPVPSSQGTYPPQAGQTTYPPAGTATPPPGHPSSTTAPQFPQATIGTGTSAPSQSQPPPQQQPQRPQQPTWPR